MKKRSLSENYRKLQKLFEIRVKLILELMISGVSMETLLWIDKKRKKATEKIDMESPKTFDDKIWYIKKYYYSSLAVKCADKVSVREYVRECGFEEILIPVYGIYDSPDEIDFSRLPDECYIKCNHNSGGNYLYRRNKTDEKWLKKMFTLYLKRDHYKASKEWVYKDIPHKIIIEDKLKNGSGLPLCDYRMFCFSGHLKVVMVNIGTATENGEHAKNVSRSFYTSEFEPIPQLSILGDEPSNIILPKPAGWDKMVKIAQKLSEPFAFCRVDLYNLDGKIYFGEMTFFPNRGVNRIRPKEWALKMGEWIELEKCRNNPIYEYRK